MADHITSIAASSIPKVTRAEFLSHCRTGMAIFCEGKYRISRGIEWFTGSCLSHVGTLIYLAEAGRWGVLEATKDHGVHIGHLDYYLDRYDGDIALVDAPELTDADRLKLVAAQFDLIDEGYDVTQEVSMVCHKLIKAFPIIEGKRELFCSGLYEVGRAAIPAPLAWDGPGMASPEQVWVDSSMVAVCALVKA